MSRILVIDDSPEILDALETFLVDMGHMVTTAPDGETGYTTAVNSSPDLVILDIDMPGKSGLEVCRELRMTPEVELTPIVILTGHTDDETLMDGLHAGCDDFLNKPPNIPVLRARVTSLLKMSKQRNQLREKERFDYMIQNMSEGLILTDVDGRIFRYNSAASHMFGIGAESEIGNDVRTFVFEKQGFTTPDWDGQISRPAGTLDMTRNHTNGSLDRAIKVRFDTMQNPVSDHKEIIFICRDVTQEVLAQKRLEVALHAAQMADRLKNIFITNMSHEIRTPLNSMLGFIQLLSETIERELTEEEKVYLQMIDLGGVRLLNTLEAILDMSELEADALSIKPEKIEARVFITEIIDKFRAPIEKKGLELIYDCTLNGEYIAADTELITTALGNILDNAIKYSDSGLIHVRIGAGRDELNLEIEDSGIGMSSDYLEHLYEPFSQESEGYRKEYQGVGLGLAITKRYLDLHQYQIKVSSKKGFGTVFKIDIPVVGM